MDHDDELDELIRSALGRVDDAWFDSAVELASEDDQSPPAAAPFLRSVPSDGPTRTRAVRDRWTKWVPAIAAAATLVVIAAIGSVLGGDGRVEVASVSTLPQEAAETPSRPPGVPDAELEPTKDDPLVGEPGPVATESNSSGGSSRQPSGALRSPGRPASSPQFVPDPLPETPSETLPSVTIPVTTLPDLPDPPPTTTIPPPPCPPGEGLNGTGSCVPTTTTTTTTIPPPPPPPPPFGG